MHTIHLPAKENPIYSPLIIVAEFLTTGVVFPPAILPSLVLWFTLEFIVLAQQSKQQ